MATFSSLVPFEKYVPQQNHKKIHEISIEPRHSHFSLHPGRTRFFFLKIFQWPGQCFNPAFGATLHLRLILADFFKHAFDGSGADNFFDAGSSGLIYRYVDGRMVATCAELIFLGPKIDDGMLDILVYKSCNEILTWWRLPQKQNYPPSFGLRRD